MNGPRLLRTLLALLLPSLLAACASSGTYEELRSEHEGTDGRALVGDFAEPWEGEAHVADDGAWEEVASQLDAARQGWEERLQALGATGAAAEQPVEPPSPEVLTELLREGMALPELLELVPSLNPGVRAARLRLRASLQAYPQATYLQDILRQYKAFTRQLDTRLGMGPHQQPMAGQFPFPDVLALQGELAKFDAQLAELELAITIRDARTALRTAYYRYLFLQSSARIYRENQQILEQMIEVAQAKIRAGEAKYRVVVMAQIELARLDDAITTFEEEQESEAATINALLGRPAEAPLGPPAEVAEQAIAPELEAIYPLALERRQELARQRLRIKRAETMVELATRMANPDATLGASYLEKGMGAEGFATQRQLPIGKATAFGQRNAYAREVELRADALRSALTEMEVEVRASVKQAHVLLTTARRGIALYEQSLLPQARQSLEASTASYRTGDTDFLTFLEAERTLLDFQLELQRAWRNYRVAKAQLDQLAGGRLPRKALDLPQPNADTDE